MMLDRVLPRSPLARSSRNLRTCLALGFDRSGYGMAANCLGAHHFVLAAACFRAYQQRANITCLSGKRRLPPPVALAGAAAGARPLPRCRAATPRPTRRPGVGGGGGLGCSTSSSTGRGSGPGLAGFQTRVSSPIDRAAAVAAEDEQEASGVAGGSGPLQQQQRAEAGSSSSSDAGDIIVPLSQEEAQEQLERGPPRPKVSVPTGVFQRIPQVSPSNEIIGTALRRSERVPFNKKLRNEGARTKNRVARQLDTLTKEVAMPLGRYIRGFPPPSGLHPFERSLLELTVGEDRYLRALARVDALRKAALEVGKSNAARANKSPGKREALQVQQEGFAAVERVYARDAQAVDDLKEVAKRLRRLPVVDMREATVALVGAPNVGKSSLVQVISSGMPEVCNYPFTTRSIKMGHFYVDGRRHQVTDTPGLLDRPEGERNAMERLTLACLQHLPSYVLFVTDLTGECGMAVQEQWAIRRSLRSMFPGKPWLDIFSKADLLEEELDAADDIIREMTSSSAAPPPSSSPLSSASPAAGATDQGGALGAQVGAETSGAEVAELVPRCAVDMAVALPEALRVSSLTGEGMEHLKASILRVMREEEEAQRQHKEQQQQEEKEAAAAAMQHEELDEHVAAVTGGLGHEQAVPEAVDFE